MNWGQVNRHQWGKTRSLVLRRDNYSCTIRLPGCRGKASEVDHIIPISQGGSVYDPDNCRAVCRPCHNHRTNNTTPITLSHPEHW